MARVFPTPKSQPSSSSPRRPSRPMWRMSWRTGSRDRVQAAVLAHQAGLAPDSRGNDRAPVRRAATLLYGVPSCRGSHSGRFPSTRRLKHYLPHSRKRRLGGPRSPRSERRQRIVPSSRGDSARGRRPFRFHGDGPVRRNARGPDSCPQMSATNRCRPLRPQLSGASRRRAFQSTLAHPARVDRLQVWASPCRRRRPARCSILATWLSSRRRYLEVTPQAIPAPCPFGASLPSGQPNCQCHVARLR